ncbi:hypothetical protein [Cellulosimicrobium sp. SH8]|uniref:hypothetical protein n=1 Tax=Cellulosimicrobium sp. SH8 TaxID=2952936 RepID=UPI0021F30562|nr:hypothetical protein [Cellulosimicrobium sp. SH8]
MEPQGTAAGQVEAAGPVEGEKNRMRWALPLDTYWVDQALGSAAEAVLVEECMRDNGFDYRRPMVDVSVRSETKLAGQQHLFNVETAAQWGYSGAPDPNAAIIRAASEAAMSWPAEQDEQYWSCLDEARKELPTEAMRIDNTLSGMGMSTGIDATRDPAVVAAAEKWVACMQPLGFTDLPSSPHGEDGGMPTMSMSASFGEIYDGKTNEQTPEQEAEEIRLATFDAECRESSGYAQALYDAEWERQATVVAENEDALATLLEDKAAYEKQAREILDGAGVG